MDVGSPALAVVLPIECFLVNRTAKPWNGDFVCWPTEINISGRGLEPDVAIVDLKAKIVALYDKLSKTSSGSLKEDELKRKEYLEERIKPRKASHGI